MRRDSPIVRPASSSRLATCLVEHYWPGITAESFRSSSSTRVQACSFDRIVHALEF